MIKFLNQFFKKKNKDRWTHICIVLGKSQETIEIWFDKKTDQLYINGELKKEIPT